MVRQLLPPLQTSEGVLVRAVLPDDAARVEIVALYSYIVSGDRVGENVSLLLGRRLVEVDELRR